jgi:hypothetical protein
MLGVLAIAARSPSNLYEWPGDVHFRPVDLGSVVTLLEHQWLGWSHPAIWAPLTVGVLDAVAFLQERTGHTAAQAGLAMIPSIIVMVALSSTVDRWRGNLSPRAWSTPTGAPCTYSASATTPTTSRRFSPARDDRLGRPHGNRRSRLVDRDQETSSIELHTT